MRVGESFGEACRNCGSTTIIIAPPSSAGRCAVCSPEAIGWAKRLEQGTQRRREMDRLASLAAEAEARALHRAERMAQRRAMLARWGAQARTTAAQWAREIQLLRPGRASQA